MHYHTDKSGQVLSYHDLPGDLVPILFIHGLGCASSSDYPEVAGSPFLAGHRRILVDLLGYGFSDKRDHVDYSLSAQVRALADLIAHLQIPRLVIFGHSMGGAVAISLAHRLQDRVHALVITEGNLDSGGGTGSRKIAAWSRAEYVAHGHALMIGENRKAGNATWAATMEVSKPAAVHQGAHDLVQGGTPSWRELLYAFPFPRTYLFGALSLPDPDTEALPRQGVRIGTIPCSGHNMAHENPAGLAEAIKKAIEVVS